MSEKANQADRMPVNGPEAGLTKHKLGKIETLSQIEDKPRTGAPSCAGGFEDMVDFNLKPEELEAYLDAYVIRQGEAKAVLATKICTHFNRIRYLEESGLKNAPSSVGMIKNNILLIGPTGVGKTYLVKLVAQKLGVPFVKGDATKFSETGYVGGDVEDLVRDLVYAAGEDVEKAQNGIIYVDEIDKIAASGSLVGPDVSRTGVQRALLKPMEETEVEMRAPHDPISQIQAIEAYRKTGKREKQMVNTRNILFIMSGAFNGLEEVIQRRLKTKSIGFAGEPDSQDWTMTDWLARVTAEDLINYGFESEFVGRMPVVVVLDHLEADDLWQILLNPNNPVVLSKKRDFAAYGVDIRFEEKALRVVAGRASEQKTGARGLVGAMEAVTLPFEKRLPSTDLTKLLVTARATEDPAGYLDRLLDQMVNRGPEAEPDLEARFEAAGDQERERLRQSLAKRTGELEQTYDLVLDDDLINLVLDSYHQAGMDVDRAFERIREELVELTCFEEALSDEYGLRISLERETSYTVIRIARQAGMNPTDYLATRREELGSALQLVRDRTGLDEFILPREAITQTAAYVQTLVGPTLQREA